jgi:hypothetical protein
MIHPPIAGDRLILLVPPGRAELCPALKVFSLPEARRPGRPGKNARCFCLYSPLITFTRLGLIDFENERPCTPRADE